MIQTGKFWYFVSCGEKKNKIIYASSPIPLVYIVKIFIFILLCVCNNLRIYTWILIAYILRRMCKAFVRSWLYSIFAGQGLRFGPLLYSEARPESLPLASEDDCTDGTKQSNSSELKTERRWRLGLVSQVVPSSPLYRVLLFQKE